MQITASTYSTLMFNNGNIFNDRITLEERKRFSQKFYDQMSASSPITLDDGIYNQALKSLKESINSELNVENMVKRCIFSIY